MENTLEANWLTLLPTASLQSGVLSLGRTRKACWQDSRRDCGERRLGLLGLMEKAHRKQWRSDELAVGAECALLKLDKLFCGAKFGSLDLFKY
jgi:hypothetical protein